jgi:hypothetical protein
MEFLCRAPARDQRVIPVIAIEVLILAAPALQAIGIGVAKEALTVAPARDQRVIPGIAIEVLTTAGPALQAIGIVAAPKQLSVAPAPDQRVIPGFAIDELTIAVTGYQKIIARCARHERDFFQNELVTAKARLLNRAYEPKI